MTARPEALDPATPWRQRLSAGYEIQKWLISGSILTMEKGGQKRQNSTVKTRKNRTNPQRNSLIDYRIDINFLNDLDKVRGSAQGPLNDSTPCPSHQACLGDYRGQENLDRISHFGPVETPAGPRGRGDRAKPSRWPEKLVIWEFTSIESQLDVTNAKTIYKNK